MATETKTVVVKQQPVVVVPDLPQPTVGNKSKQPANMEAAAYDAEKQTPTANTSAGRTAVGERVDKTGKDAVYVTPDNKQMFVHQVDDVNKQVFAGERGHNSKWYPKAVVETWAKL